MHPRRIDGEFTNVFQAIGEQCGIGVVVGQALGVTLGLIAVAGVQRDRVQARRCLAAFAGLSLAALGIFIAVNPAIWRDPIGGLCAPFLEQKLSAELQAQFLGGALDNLGSQLAAVADLTALGYSGLVVITVLAVALLFCADWRYKAVACWWLVAFAAVTKWLPFARTRYALPLVLPAVLVLSVALDVAYDWWSGGAFDEVAPGAEK